MVVGTTGVVEVVEVVVGATGMVEVVVGATGVVEVVERRGRLKYNWE